MTDLDRAIVGHQLTLQSTCDVKDVKSGNVDQRSGETT